ncbi:MAG TPA: DUF4157 domain-containing protein [Steroidobacteraceae bacterium]
MNWLGRTVHLPQHIASALEALLGTPVQHVQIFEHSAFVRLHGRAVATTRRRRIYLRDSAEEFFGDPWLLLHEYCHVIRQWEPRTLTIPRYLAECLRRGYWNNCFEIEARAFADAHAHRLRVMLGPPHVPPLSA